MVDKVFDLNVAEFLGVAGVWGVAAATLLAEEDLLKSTHMLLDGILGILLHARVDGGVDLEAVGIDVVFGPVGLGVFLDPSEKGIFLPGYGIVDVALVFPSAVIGQHGLLGRKYAAELLAEIWCEAVLVVDAVEVEFQRQLLERISLGRCEHALLLHLLEHGVAAQTRTIGMAHGIVVGGILHHSDKCGRLLNVEVLGGLSEIYPRGRLDSHCVVEEVELVEIHLDNLILRVVALELHGYHPFYGLLERTVDDSVGSGGIELFGQLLGDGGAAAGVFLAHDKRLDKHTHECAHIDAGMVLETGILGGDESVDHVLRDFVVVGVYAVARIAVVTAHFLAVGRIENGSELIVGVLQLLDRRHIAYPAVVDQQEKYEHGCEADCKYFPYPSDNKAVTAPASRHILGVVCGHS